MKNHVHYLRRYAVKNETISQMVIFHKRLLILVTLFIINCSSEKRISPVMFTRSPQIFTPAATNQIGLEDLDGDGDLDVFVAFYGDGSNSIWFNMIK